MSTDLQIKSLQGLGALISFALGRARVPDNELFVWDQAVLNSQDEPEFKKPIDDERIIVIVRAARLDLLQSGFQPVPDNWLTCFITRDELTSSSQLGWPAALAEQHRTQVVCREISAAILRLSAAMPEADGVESTQSRRGRLNRDESEAKRTEMLAKLRQHPTMTDDLSSLATEIGVSESTVRRWIGEEQRRFTELQGRNDIEQ
jgi:hypothetical protein